MKTFLLITLLIALVSAEKCPAKVLKIATSEMKSYLKGYYKKVGKIKLNCDYEHDSNIFNLEHRIKAKVIYNKRKLSFEIKTHSSMFNLFDFQDFDGKICHSKFGSEKKKNDIDLIKKNFLKAYGDSIKNKDIKRSEKNGLICYGAKITKKKRTLI